MIAEALVALALCKPCPVPHPSAPKGRKITWVSYSYDVPDTTGNFLMRCFVPVKGRRHCKVIGIIG